MRSELNDDARALIRAAVSEERPAVASHREELKRSLLARAALLGAGAAASASVPNPSPLAESAVATGTCAFPGAGAALPSTAGALPGIGALGALLAKGAGVGILVAGTVHGVTHFTREDGRSSASTPTSSAANSTPNEARQAHGSIASPPVAAPNAAPLPHAATPPLAASDGSLAAITPGTPHSDTAPTESPPSLRAELELMGAVQAALRDGHSARALDLVDRHASLYPRGQLVNERLAAEAIAACQSGNEARGRRAAETFLQRDPTSALAARVRGACPTGKNRQDR